MRKLRVWVAMVLCLLGAVTTARAGIVAYDNTCVPPNQGGGCTNQNFGNSLGLDFEVNAPIDVLALGMYNGGNDYQQYIYAGKDGESGITVLIYKIDSPGCTTCNPSIVASVHFDASDFNSLDPVTYGEGQQIGAETFQYLPSAVELLPGYYSVVTFNDWNWNANVDNPNWPNNDYTTLNDGGGLITFDGSGRFDPQYSCQYFPDDPGCSGSYFGFPTTVDGGPVDRYMAGSFIFDTVPEPSTLGLMGIGLLGVWASRRRRRQN